VPHQEINASANEALECVLVRSDNEAVVVNLDIDPAEKPEQVLWIDRSIKAKVNSRSGWRWVRFLFLLIIALSTKKPFSSVLATLAQPPRKCFLNFEQAQEERHDRPDRHITTSFAFNLVHYLRCTGSDVVVHRNKDPRPRT